MYDVNFMQFILPWYFIMIQLISRSETITYVKKEYKSRLTGKI